MTYFVLILSFAALIGGADLLVRGAVTVAARLGVSTLVIGLTVVALGTSAPELVVSVGAGLQGEYGIALGNIIGSNIANILLIGGLAAFCAELYTHEAGNRRNALILAFATLFLIAIVLTARLPLWAGVLALGGQALLLWFAFRAGEASEEAQPEDMPLPRAVILTLAGLILVVLGGAFLVPNAERLALAWGVPEAIIGLTVIAIGTSLPELATTLAGLRRLETRLILGNIVGSNISNILIVFGATALLAPGRLGDYGDMKVYLPQLTVMAVATLVLVGYMLAGRHLCRRTGMLMLLAYFVLIFGSLFIRDYMV